MNLIYLLLLQKLARCIAQSILGTAWAPQKLRSHDAPTTTF